MNCYHKIYEMHFDVPLTNVLDGGIVLEYTEVKEGVIWNQS